MWALNESLFLKIILVLYFVILNPIRGGAESVRNFWFFTVFWGDLEGAGWFSPPPCSQATSRSPAQLGLILYCFLTQLGKTSKKTVNFRTIINKGRGVGSEFFRTNFFAIVTFSVCHYFPPWFFYFQPFSIFKVFIVILIFFLVFFPNLLKKGLQFL